MSLVCGLLRHIIRGGGFCETEGALEDYTIDTYSKLLIDGNSYAWRLFETRALDGQQNCQEQYDRQVRTFFTQIPCVKVVMLEEEQSKCAKLSSTDSILTGGCRGRLLPPPLPVDSIRAIARDFGYDVLTCVGPTHNRLADLSRELQCPIVTDDGRFLRKPSKHGLIHWDSLKSDSTDCKILKLDHPHRPCEELGRDKLGLINALIRDRPVRIADKFRVAMMIRSQMAFIISPRECNPSAGDRWNRRLLAGVWSHLCCKTYEEAREFVLSLVDGWDQATAESIMEEGSFDLEFDQATKELRDAIEEICECPNHRRMRVVSWLDFLHESASSPKDVLELDLCQLRTKIDKLPKTRGARKSADVNCRAALLECLKCSSERFDRRPMFSQPDQDSLMVKEFFTVKLLLHALESGNARTKLMEHFKEATLACLIYYLGDDEFLEEFRKRVAAAVRYSGHKLRTPLKSVPVGHSSIVDKVRTLVSAIGGFNAVNSQIGYPLQAVQPEKWLNPCLICMLTEDPMILGHPKPEEIVSCF